MVNNRRFYLGTKILCIIFDEYHVLFLYQTKSKEIHHFRLQNGGK